MISRDRLFSRIRRMLGDEEMRAYSDYEIAQAIDDGLDWLSHHLALLGSDLTETSTTLADGDALPADLITLRTVIGKNGDRLIPLRIGMPIADGGYRIERDTFRAAETCTVTYHRALPLLGDNDTLDLPARLAGTIAKTAILILGGADDTTRAKALAEDTLILTRRRGLHRRAALPWRI